MEINSQFKNATVYIKCINFQGSGCLIQPETNKYTYVLTAKHCLIGTDKDNLQKFCKEDIEVLRYKDDIKEKKLVVLDYHLNSDENIDLAIIKVAFEEDLIPLRFDKTSFGIIIHICGYPGVLDSEDDCDKIDYLKGEIYEPGGLQKKLEFKMLSSNETNDTTKGGNIEGFSGSGIFSNDGKYITLHGIYEGLKESKGRLDGCLGYNIEQIEEMIKELGLKPLTHYKLKSFDFYVEEALSYHCDLVKVVLESKIGSLTDISPKSIIEQMKEKIFIPYGTEDVLDNNLWIGWLKILLYLQVYKIDINDVTRIIYDDTSGEKSKVAILYAPRGKRFREVIGTIFRNIDCYSDLTDGNTLIINTKDNVAGDSICGRKSMNRVIARIDGPTRYKVGIDIRDPNCTKNISAIHINEFSRKLDMIDDMDNIDPFDVEKEIIRIIKEVFKSVIEG